MTMAYRTRRLTLRDALSGRVKLCHLLYPTSRTLQLRATSTGKVETLQGTIGPRNLRFTLSEMKRPIDDLMSRPDRRYALPVACRGAYAAKASRHFPFIAAITKAVETRRRDRYEFLLAG